MRHLIFLISFISVLHVSAQTCCSGGIPLSNNIGLDFQDVGSFQLGITYDYNYLNTLKAGTQNLEDNARQRITHSALVNLGYTFSNKLSVEGLLTYVNQRREITQITTDLDQTSGIGDAVVLIKYRFDKFLNNKLIIGIGSKLPLGSSTKTDDQGITYNADLQPGSNAFDLLYFTQYGFQANFRPSFSINSRLIYRATGTNNSYFGDTTYKFGNELQAFLNFSDQFVLNKTLINPSLSLKYRHAALDEIGGSELNNTGGDWWFIIPNLSVDLNATLGLFARAEIPIYSNVYGTQLTPTYRISTGILFTFKPKQFENSTR